MYINIVQINVTKLGVIVSMIIMCSLSTGYSSEATNPIPANLFVTDDGSLIRYKGSGEVVIAPTKIREASTAKESRPADQDTEGNWGEVIGGLQMSLRFEKRTYSLNEPIKAEILLRNVTDKPIDYVKIYTAEWPIPIGISISNNDKPLARKSHTDEIIVTSGRNAAIFPRTQHKYSVDLSKYFAFESTGDYVIHATYKISSAKASTGVDLISGNATIVHHELDCIYHKINRT